MKMDDAIRAFAFPFRIDAHGGVASTRGLDALRESLKQLFLTRAGERLMLREYGGGVAQLLQENINDGIVAVSKHLIAQAILRFEPRIVTTDIAIVPRGAELYVRIRYISPDGQGFQSMAIPLR